MSKRNAYQLVANPDAILSPATMTSMLAPHAHPIVRRNFNHSTGPGVMTSCVTYFTQSPRRPIQPLRPGRQSLANNTLAAITNLATNLPVHPPAVAALEAWNITVRAEQHPLPLIPEPDFIFTHGRGSGLDNPSLIAFSEGFARTQTILSFEEQGELTERTATFRALLNAFPSASTLGGRSKGGRASVRAQIWSSANKLILFTYPLVRGTEKRYEELLMSEETTDVLFITGDSDPLCVEMHLRDVRQRMRAKTWWIKIVNGDHALWYEPESKRHALCNIAGQIAAQWNVQRHPDNTELTLDWDEEVNVPKWTGWTEYVKDVERRQRRFSIGIRNSTLSGGDGDG